MPTDEIAKRKQEKGHPEDPGNHRRDKGVDGGEVDGQRRQVRREYGGQRPKEHMDTPEAERAADPAENGYAADEEADDERVQDRRHGQSCPPGQREAR